MPEQTLDLTGTWEGEYAYLDHVGPVTPFVATIVERDGNVGGRIIEPDTIHGHPVIEAVIHGTRVGREVAFTKAYDRSAGPYYTKPVDYLGTLSDDGNVVTGNWRLSHLSGTFEMRREIGQAETAGVVVEDALPEPVSTR